MAETHDGPPGSVRRQENSVGLPNKSNARPAVALVVAPEIIGVQEQEHSPTGLVADEGLLLGL